MSNFRFIDGHGRRALVRQHNVFVGSGADFGDVLTSQYSRLTGMASIVGSMTVRIRSAVASGGPYLVSSNWSVNSGPNLLDSINYGDYTRFDVTAAKSQVCSILIRGEPLR
jgi:hypothetical protein